MYFTLTAHLNLCAKISIDKVKEVSPNDENLTEKYVTLLQLLNLN